MPLVEHISFRRLPKHSELFLQYVESASPALAFYQTPPSIAAIKALADTGTPLSVAPRGPIASILKRQNEQFGCGATTQENIQELRHDNCVAVLTGQQVGLFTGPLYTVYKALTCIRLADELRSRNMRAVPIFWMDSEDHDLAEVLRVATADSEGRPALLNCAERLFGSAVPPSCSVGPLVLGDGIGDCLSEYTAGLAAHEWSHQVRRQLESAYAPGHTLARAFACAMTELFSRHGLIFFDTMDPEAKRLARPVVERAIVSAAEIRAALRERGDALHEAGYHRQVNILEDSTVLFVVDDGGRKALTSQGSVFGLRHTPTEWTGDQLIAQLDDRPESFSPSVMLRPLVQDYLFPTVAYVAGPAEIAYFAQIETLYRLFGRRMPAIWPRAAFTLLDHETTGLIERHALEFTDCFSERDRLIEKMLAGSGHSEAVQEIRLLKSYLDRGLADLRPQVVSVDLTLGPALDNARRKILFNIDRLARRAVRLEAEQDRVMQRDAERIMSACYPLGSLQERIYGIYPFLARYGPSLIDQLYGLIRIEGFYHQVVRLENSR